MLDEVVFYTNPMSRGRIVRWMLEEVGRPYRTEIVGYGPAMKTPEYLALNPMGKVPVIRHGDTIVTECAAICAYLADAFPAAGLAPAVNDRLRGTYYRWLFFGAGPVEAASVNAAMGVVVPDDKRGFVGYGSLEAVVDTLDKALADREYLTGTFSAADVYVGAELGWLMDFGTIERRPAFERYVGRLRARPAAKRAAEIDDALMPKQGNPAA